MAAQYFLAEALADAITAKRGSRSLRDIAAEMGGVSASTLSRIERHGPPDLPTLLRICGWLCQPLTDFIGDTPASLPPVLDAWVRTERARAKLLRQEAGRFEQTAATAERAIEHALARFAAGEPVETLVPTPADRWCQPDYD